MRTLKIFAIGAAALLASTHARAQTLHSGGHTGGHHDAAAEPEAGAFIDRAREATARYQDIDVAIGAGYRLMGPDFPGMGEHWVNIHYAVQPEVNIERPAVLSYLRLDGRPILTGVAYTQPVQPGEVPADAGVPGIWHFHSGTVDEETLLLNPRAMDHAGADQPRLAMLHAWIWVDNPAGVFQQDNWALPFLRAGLSVPDSIPPQAGKALHLLTGGVEYYARLIEVAGRPTDADRAAVEGVLKAAHDRVARRHGSMQSASSSDIAWLVAAWHELWMEIKRVVTPELWARIEMLAG